MLKTLACRLLIWIFSSIRTLADEITELTVTMHWYETFIRRNVPAF